MAESPPKKAIGKTLSRIGPIREMVELSVMTLKRLPQGKLLDVGCGNGQFLAMMQDLGWEVVGVEPDGQAVKAARACLGLSVYEGTLEEAGFPEDSFDAITMNHVIEHVWDPISTLRECRRVLKVGGRLVVITPSIWSLGARLFSKAWLPWEPPRHLFLFSPRTLQECAEQAGLRVLKLWTTARSAHWICSASYSIRRNGTLPGGLLQRQSLWLQFAGFVFQLVEYGLCWVTDAGEEIVLIATRG